MVRKTLACILAGMVLGTTLLVGCEANQQPQLLTEQPSQEAFVETRAGRIMPAPMADKTPATEAPTR